MNDAQVAEIVRQVTEAVAAELAATVVPKLKRIAEGQDRLRKSLKIHDLKADGETEATHPWLKLDRMRRYQVEDVYQFMLAHRHERPEVNTIPRACRETFHLIRSGYPNAEALASYCYSLPLTDFI